MLCLEETVGPMISTGGAQPISTVSSNGWESQRVIVGGETLIHVSSCLQIREHH